MRRQFFSYWEYLGWLRLVSGLVGLSGDTVLCDCNHGPSLSPFPTIELSVCSDSQSACRSCSANGEVRPRKAVAGLLWRRAMHTLSSERRDVEEQTFIDGVINRRGDRPGALLGILQVVQDHNPHKYLPLDTLRYIAAKTQIPFSRVY